MDRNQTQRNSTTQDDSGSLIAQEWNRTLDISSGLSTSQRFSKVTHLIFDADDTLWDDQGKLQDSEQRMERLFDAHLGQQSGFKQRFIDIENRNIPIIGYGFHSYLFSLAQAIFEEKSCAELHAPALQLVKGLIHDFLHEPPRVFPGTRETLLELRARGYSLAIATRGIPGEQREKVTKSGLEDLFDHIFVVAKKDTLTYRSITDDLSVDPAACCMIGNSLKSDVKPALDAGFCAIHIPEPNTWAHDTCTPVNSLDAMTLSDLKELLGVFAAKL